MTRVSVYKNSYDKTGVNVSIDKVIAYLCEGKNGLDEKTRICNALAQTDPDGYKAYKASQLPAVTWAGRFTTRDSKVESNKRLVEHSGMVVLDIDDVDIGLMQAALFDNPFVYLSFVSPSGRGVKIVSPTDPVPASVHEHKVAWRACKEAFEELQADCDFTIDPSGSDVTRLCYLAHDERAIYHPDAKAVTWDPDDAKIYEKPDPAENHQWRGYVDLSALDFIDPDSDYEVWLHVGMACKNAGLSFDIWNAWSAGGSKYRADEMHAKWNSFNRTGISWGTVVFFAKQKGYEPPRQAYQKPVRLTRDMLISDGATETLDDAGDFIKSVLAKDTSGQVFGLRVDTGTGKTEQALVVKNARPIILTGSHLLGQEIVNRATEKGIQNFLYRGLMYNPGGEFPYESPCIKPVLMDELRRAGANPYLHGCKGCEVRERCEIEGHRAQWKELKAGDNRLLVLAMRQLFINPIFANFAKERLDLKAEDLVLVDDASTEGLFLDVSVSLERLQRLSRRWKGKPTGTFALELIQAMSTLEGDDLVDGIKAVYEQSKEQSETIYRQLRKVNIDGTEVNIDFAIENGHYPIDTPEERARLPIVEHTGWTLLDKLRVFFKAYPDTKTAPMRYVDGILHWALPPRLLNVPAALGFMGATLDKDVFQRTFQKTLRHKKVSKRSGKPYMKYTKYPADFYETIATEWHADARVFQLRTNGNPRATLLADSKTGELSKTGEEYWDYFLNSLKVNEGKHAVISFKSLIEARTSELKNNGVAFSHFHNTEGLDTHFSDCDVFHIIGLPARAPADIEWLSRVWQVSGDEVIKKVLTGELTQAVGRARLVRKPTKLILWTSHYIENVTDRAVLFDESDWKEADGDLSILADVVSKRENETDAKALSEKEGISERTARRRTFEKRMHAKAERDADILKRYNAGQSKRAIAKVLGVARSTVDRALAE